MIWRQICAVAMIPALLAIPGEAGVRPTEDGMFRVYQNNRAEGIGNYVTRDFLLLGYSMILTEEIAAHEQKYDYPDLRASIEALSAAAEKATGAKPAAPEKPASPAKAGAPVNKPADKVKTADKAATTDNPQPAANPGTADKPKTADQPDPADHSAPAEHADTIEAARANRAFLAVLLNLLDGTEAPAGDKDDKSDKLVAAELAQIRAASAVGKSELLSQTIDYSQFRPRGHYTRTPELSRYFQAVRYAGAALFYVKESAATGIDAATADRLTRQALLLAHWIRSDPATLQRVEKFESRRAWLFGPAEDLTLADLDAAVAQSPHAATSSHATTTPHATTAELRAKLLARAKTTGRQPMIFAAVIDPQKLESGVSARDALTGWRLLPGSFTPDGAAAQQLVYDRVGKFLGDGTPVSLTTVNGTPVKGFPLGLEIMALLGSADAAKKLAASQDTNYEGYAKARAEAARLIVRPSGLPGEQLHLMATVLGVAAKTASASAAPTKDASAKSDSAKTAPASAAAIKGDVKEKEVAEDDRLDGALGFWTLARHQSILYSKQSYTGAGKGILPADSRKTAWLEPSTAVYQELRQISGQLETRLGSQAFGRFGKILDQCIAISQTEQAGRKLSTADIAFLNGIDQELIPMTGGPDEPIAVDVHTDVNSGQVLIEALRYPTEVKHAAQSETERGARFQTAEFKRPLSDRITDESWRATLAAEKGVR